LTSLEAARGTAPPGIIIHEITGYEEEGKLMWSNVKKSSENT
jgi:hypothetical protein